MICSLTQFPNQGFNLLAWTSLVSNIHSWLRIILTLQWHHNGCDGASNHQPRHCLLNRLFGRRSKKISKLRLTGLCAGNSPVTGEYPAQMASNADNVSIWWRHHQESWWLCSGSLALYGAVGKLHGGAFEEYGFEFNILCKSYMREKYFPVIILTFTYLFNIFPCRLFYSQLCTFIFLDNVHIFQFL